MIKERNLVPGRMLKRCFSLDRNPWTGRPTPRDRHGDPDSTWVPCMVIATYRDVDRRHSKRTAPTNGWEVLVWWFVDEWTQLEQVRITPNNDGWRVLW